MSRVAGMGSPGNSSLAPSATISGITISQARPPRRPVLGRRGARSHSASFRTCQRSDPCSRRTRTSTNCQTSPAVSMRIRARGSAVGPSRRCASQGAASQARPAIGSAAAAQVPRMRARPYCGSRAGSAAEVVESWAVAVTATSFDTAPWTGRPGHPTVGAARQPVVAPAGDPRSAARRTPRSSTGMTPADQPAGYGPDVATDLGARFGHHGVTALAACFALGALVEDLVRPSVTLGAGQYDRGPDAVIAASLAAVVTLV